MATKDDDDLSARLEKALAVLEWQKRTVERLSLLVEASRTLTATLDLCQVFDGILALATRHTGADRATLFLVDAERGELWSLIAQGLGHKEIRLPVGQGLAGWVAKNGLTLNLPDAHQDPRFDARFDEIFAYRTRSILVMPVRSREGRVIGVLELLNKRGGPFSLADVQLMNDISVHAAIALENARLHRNSLERQRVEQELALAAPSTRACCRAAPGWRASTPRSGTRPVRPSPATTTTFCRSAARPTCSRWPTWRGGARAPRWAPRSCAPRCTRWRGTYAGWRRSRPSSMPASSTTAAPASRSSSASWTCPPAGCTTSTQGTRRRS